MEDLIRRSGAIKAFCMDCKGQGEPCEHSDTCKTMKVLRSRKKIPAVEPKQGEWIKDKRQDVLLKAFIDKGEEWRVCSVCGTGYKIGERTNGHYHAYFRNYCPNCGARMKGADDE